MDRLNLSMHYMASKLRYFAHKCLSNIQTYANKLRLVRSNLSEWLLTFSANTLPQRFLSNYIAHQLALLKYITFFSQN